MAFPLFMACVAAFLVASILAPAGLLWVAAWAWRSPSRRFRRMLGAAMAIVVVNIAVFGSISWLANRMSPPVDGPEPPGLLALLLVGVGMSFAAQWMIVKRATQAGAWRSLAVFLTWEFVSSAAGVSGAVVVRTTWMEAYVVPTGAMAPTILGVHALSECPACAHPLAVGLSQRTARFPSIGDESPPPLDVFCPNCAQGWQLPSDVATTSGDRVLVDKTAAPCRWDLVAYNTGGPPTVYAKRLIGLPGEQLTIEHGDVLIRAGHESGFQVPHSSPGTKRRGNAVTNRRLARRVLSQLGRTRLSARGSPGSSYTRGPRVLSPRRSQRLQQRLPVLRAGAPGQVRRRRALHLLAAGTLEMLSITPLRRCQAYAHNLPVVPREHAFHRERRMRPDRHPPSDFARRLHEQRPAGLLVALR